jgi:hypothetical protein
MDSIVLDLANRERATSELAEVARDVAREDRYREVSLGFAAETARAEAQRCLRCDVVTSCQLVEVKRKVSV